MARHVRYHLIGAYFDLVHDYTIKHTTSDLAELKNETKWAIVYPCEKCGPNCFRIQDSDHTTHKFGSKSFPAVLATLEKYLADGYTLGSYIP